jgi:ParB-like chromosome segregation protein Spo0J
MDIGKVGRLWSGDQEFKGRKVKDIDEYEVSANDAGGHDDPTKSNYPELEAHVAEHGVQEPLVISGRTLLDGHHRYTAAKKLGIKSLPVVKQ